MNGSFSVSIAKCGWCPVSHPWHRASASISLCGLESSYNFRPILFTSHTADLC